MDLPCSALGAVELAPVPPPCPLLRVLPPGTRHAMEIAPVSMSVCMHTCVQRSHPRPLLLRLTTRLWVPGLVPALPPQCAEELWAPSGPGLGAREGQGVRSPDPVPPASHASHPYCSGSGVGRAVTSPWQPEVHSAELPLHPVWRGPQSHPGVWARPAATPVALHPPWRRAQP